MKQGRRLRDTRSQGDQIIAISDYGRLSLRSIEKAGNQPAILTSNRPAILTGNRPVIDWK